MVRYVIGNWKMNLGEKESERLVKSVASRIGKKTRGLEVGVCPSFTALSSVSRAVRRTKIKLGAQDVFSEPNGAYTGEVSLRQLREFGVEYVLVGHSERRAYAGESDAMVSAKLRTVMSSLAIPVLCLGETKAELKAGTRDRVIERHLTTAFKGVKPKSSERIIVAYEPIWAIGTGLVCDPAEAEAAHAHIRKLASKLLGKDWSRNNLAVIYGGSVNAKNVKGFVARRGIDGVLVGGASLKAGEFVRIVETFGGHGA